MVDLSTEICCGIRLQNPVMNAAGTFDFEFHRRFVDFWRLGAYVHKSVTLNPRAGNSQPRLYEVRRGLINRIGLQNIGVTRFVTEKLPLMYGLEIPLIVSVAGESIEDYLETCLILEKGSSEMISALEINVSCPNVKDGMAFGSSPNLVFELTSALKRTISLPLIVKLTPNVGDIASIAMAVEKAGADAISLINAVKATALIKRGPYSGQWITGGLTGPCIKKIALARVREVAEAVGLPIIGMGGIFTPDDALEFLAIKNVKAIVVGTASFREPTTMTQIVQGLKEYFRQNGIFSIAEFKERS